MKIKHRWPMAVLMALVFVVLHPGRAYSQEDGDTPTTTPIKHLVVIFQENVSFDHYFATYPRVTRNTDGTVFFTKVKSDTSSVNNLLSAGLLTHNPNQTNPFRLDRSQAVTCDQDHDYGDEQKAFNSGLMDKFVESVGAGSSLPFSCPDFGLGAKLVMGYYDGNTVTALWNYAQNFAMSDNSFGSTFGPSTPGAINLISGQTFGATMVRGNPQENIAGGASSGAVIGDPRPAFDDCVPSTKATISMAGMNVGDLLNTKGVSWGWFQGGFRPTLVKPDGTAVCGAISTNLAGATKDYIPHHEPFQYYRSTSNPHHLPPSSKGAIGLTDQANHQYDLQDFFDALSASYLPAVSFLKAKAIEDGHAGYSDPLDEQRFLVNTINRLMKSDKWDEMAIVIAYDDSDGWYDHVMGPIVMQSDTDDDFLTGQGHCGTAKQISPGGPVQEGRCGYGPRLPLLVISPWTRVNFVDHSVTDQASILRFIEDNWGLDQIGNGARDVIAGSLWSFFNFDEGPHAKKLILDPNTGKPASDDN